MGFNPTFYAGRPKISEVTIDSDLDMGGRNIHANVMNANVLRAARVYSPIDTSEWPTETLDWGDTEAADIPTTATELIIENCVETIFDFDSAGDSARIYRYALNIGAPLAQHTSVEWYFELIENGVVTYTSPKMGAEKSSTRDVVIEGFACDLSIRGGEHVTGRIHTRYGNLLLRGATLYNTGYAVVMSLTNAWLALGLDMLSLDVTVRIQGVDMPYDDYAKYFPLAPSELTLPDDWDATQTRPDVEVYL